MMVKLIGGPQDGCPIDVRDPSERLLIPVMPSVRAFWAAENEAIFKEDENGVRYYPCEDGKYRTPECKAAVYVLKENDGQKFYEYTGMEGPEPKEYVG